MSVFLRNRWFALAGAITLAFAVVSAAMPKGVALEALSDLTYFALLLAAGAIMLWNGWSVRGVGRRFWILLSAGYFLWAANAGSWIYYETVLRKTFPDPCFMDIFLFLHLIPIIGALGLRPHRARAEQKFGVATLDFLLLLVWWIFLYAFVVFPAQYVNLNVGTYDRNFGALYLLQSGVLVLLLGIVARGASGGWKKMYLHLMFANAFYAVASQAVNFAISRGVYYSGSWYDILLIGGVAWMAAVALNAREGMLEGVQAAQARDPWAATSVRLASLAILSLPILGVWTFLRDDSPAPTTVFRLSTVLLAMLALGAFMFLRQYLQDRALIRLLEDSRRSFETEQRLQSHLVQREKLASLGQLVAGAAQEIDDPLHSIMDISQQLRTGEKLTGEQENLVRKIVHHSQRTRELVANLLSFAQQSSGQKRMLDIRALLQRSVHMRERQRHDRKIRVELSVQQILPQILGDGQQLFQALAQIAENAMDALEEAGGGVLRVSAHTQGDELVIEFSDNGPGMKEPLRVFDPFYTTKPIGKGTGLGLSAVYGVIQDHQGNITCQNNPDGGASFTLRLPVAIELNSQALAAAKA